MMNLREYLQSRLVAFDWFLHRPASTASRLASHVHVPGKTVAKGVLIRGEGRYLLAILPATRRVDLVRLAQILRGETVSVASEAEVATVFPDCERGAVPPFGRLYGLPCYLDASLGGTGVEITCVGNQRHEGLRLSFADFIRLEDPVIADFSIDSGVDRRPRLAS